MTDEVSKLWRKIPTFKRVTHACLTSNFDVEWLTKPDVHRRTGQTREEVCVEGRTGPLVIYAGEPIIECTETFERWRGIIVKALIAGAPVCAAVSGMRLVERRIMWVSPRNVVLAATHDLGQLKWVVEVDDEAWGFEDVETAIEAVVELHA